MQKSILPVTLLNHFKTLIELVTCGCNNCANGVRSFCSIAEEKEIDGGAYEVFKGGEKCANDYCI